MCHVVIDIECTKAPRHYPWIEGSKLVSVHVKEKDRPARAYLFNHPESTVSFARCVEEIQEAVDRADILVNQNLKFDLHWLEELGIKLGSIRLFCTQVAEYLLQGQTVKMPSLNRLCEIHGVEKKIDQVSEMWDAGYDTPEIPAEILIPYGNRDVCSTEQVYLKQRSLLTDRGLMPLARIQMAAMRMYARAERAGLLLDVDLLAQKSAEYLEDVEEIDRQLNALADNQIENWNSSDQKSCFFFGGKYKSKIHVDEYDALTPEQQALWKVEKRGRVWVHGYKLVKGLGFTPPDGSESDTKDGVYSTDSTTLAALRCKTKDQRKALKLIKERNKKTKIRSTYLEGLQKKVQADGLCHPNYNQTITITGRGSSSDPNGQNLPRDKTGPVKVAVITRYGS